MKLTCRRRLMRGTKQDLVAELKTSNFCRGLLADIGRTALKTGHRPSWPLWVGFRVPSLTTRGLGSWLWRVRSERD